MDEHEEAGGRPEAARAAEERALRRAESLAFPYGAFSLGYVTSLLAVTRRLAGEHDDAARLGRELMALGTQHGFRLWELSGGIHVLLDAARGGVPEALDRLAEAVAAWRNLLAADVWTPYWLTELAAAVGQHAEHLEVGIGHQGA